MIIQPKYHTTSHNILILVDAVVGIPFGSHENGDSIGISNTAIIDTMVRVKKAQDSIRNSLCEGYSIPMATQWEMTEADDPPKFDIVIGQVNDDRIYTYQFFYELRKKCPGWRSIIIIAHPDHIWRASRIAKKFGFTTFVPTNSIQKIPYDPESKQPWCRQKWKFPLGIRAALKSPENWPFMLREPFVRAHHAIKGWI